MQKMKYNYVNQKSIGINVTASDIRGASDFENEWLKIDARFNVIIVRRGYAWDGCSPKLFSVLGLVNIGTPDGISLPDGYRITGKASLVHDALYQFIDEHDLTRKQCDKIFKMQLQRDGFKLWPVYYAGVRVFGGVFNLMYKKFVK
jgi:hypothetical protein